MAVGTEIKVKGDEIEEFKNRLEMTGKYLGREIGEDKKDYESNIVANSNAHVSFGAEKALRKNTQDSAIQESKNVATMKKYYEDTDQQACDYITVDLTADIPDYDKYTTNYSGDFDEAEVQKIYDEIMADEAKKKSK